MTAWLFFSVKFIKQNDFGLSMDLFEAIVERRSVRKFTEEPVAWGDVVRIIEAGMNAPSSGNLQNWRLLIVTEAAKRKAIAEASAQQYWMEKAPVFIVICSDMDKMRKFYGIRGERLYAIQNCAAAAQNMLLAAHSLGLGACWIGAFDENAVQRVIENPDGARIEAIIPVGHPDERAENLGRYPIETVCYFEKWGNRIKDMPGVLWDFNIAGHLAKAGRKAGESISKSSKSIIKRISERIKKKKR
jgi:nitroreductase